MNIHHGGHFGQTQYGTRVKCRNFVKYFHQKMGENFNQVCLIKSVSDTFSV